MFTLFLTLLFSVLVASDRTEWLCNVPTTVSDNFPSHPTVFNEDFSNYNLVSFGGLTCRSGDIEGAAAIQGNLQAATFSIGAVRQTAGAGAPDQQLRYSAVIGGNCAWTSGALDLDGTGNLGPEEYMYVGGTFSGEPDLGARATLGSPLDSVFDNAQSYYFELSQAFFSMPATITGSVQYGGLTIDCPSAAAQVIVMHVTAAEMNTVSYYTVNAGCNVNNMYIINIDATASTRLVFTGDNMPEAIPMENILYNVMGSTSILHHDASMWGNLLAPNSTYTCTTGVWEGLVIVDGVLGMNQINRPYCPPHPVANTPSTCVTWETDCTGLHFTGPVTGETDSFVEYNVVSFGDFTANTGDVQGRVAAQGNVNIGAGFSIGASLSTLNDSPNVHQDCGLLVGGNLTWVSGALLPDAQQFPLPGIVESACVANSFSVVENDLAVRTVNSADLTAVFSAAQTCYCGMSDVENARADTTSHYISFDGLFVTCNDAAAQDNVITLTSSEFSQFTYTTLGNCLFNSRWVINVVGTDDVTISGDSWPSVASGTLYNFGTAQRTVNLIATGLNGHFLGCRTTLNQPTGVIIGKVVAGSVTMMNQINTMQTCYLVSNVTVPVVATAPASAGQTVLRVFGGSTFQAGDSTSLGQISSVNGDELTFSAAFTSPVNTGLAGTMTLSSNAVRKPALIPSFPQDNSASMAGVAVAATVVAALLI